MLVNVRLPVYFWGIVLGLGFLAACSGTSQTPVLPPPGSDGDVVQGGPPAGLYSCMHRYSTWNGTFYEHYSFHVDDLRILPGGRYLSNLSDEEGRYSYDAATRTVSYSGVYLEEGYTGTYEPPESRDDGRPHIENITQVDGEDFKVNCLGE